MGPKRDDVIFKVPRYNPELRSIDMIPESDIVDCRNNDSGSTEAMSSGTVNRPSLAAQEERRRSSEARMRQRSSSSQSTKFGAVASEIDPKSTRTSSTKSENLAQSKQLRESVDTRDALTNFAPIAAEYMKKEEERKARLEKYRDPDPSLDEELKRLHERYSGSHSWTRRMFPLLRPARADDEANDFKSLVKVHFPPRSEVRVYITDFKEHSADTREYRLSEIMRHMESKPKDVQVRWIHAPLGLGPLHSSVEDIFRHGGPIGKKFRNWAGLGFPYVELEVLNLVDRSRFQKMRDVYHFLHDDRKLTEQLNADCWVGFEPSSQTEGLGVLDDIRWRTTHVGLAEDWKTLPNFWTACNSDVPRQLTEGAARAGYDPLDGLNPTLWQSDKQALHKHRFFGSVQVVRDPFRCFHRGDGTLRLFLEPAGSRL